jgi:hypothetical protein
MPKKPYTASPSSPTGGTIAPAAGGNPKPAQ